MTLTPAQHRALEVLGEADVELIDVYTSTRTSKHGIHTVNGLAARSLERLGLAELRLADDLVDPDGWACFITPAGREVLRG